MIMNKSTFSDYIKNIKKLAVFVLVFSILVFPLVSFALKSELIPCGTESTPLVTKDGVQTGGEIIEPCTFNHLLTMVNNVVDFVLFRLALPIAAILFAYAGFMLITSGGEVGKKKKALGVFWNVGLGLVIMAAAWLIINTILSILGFDGSWIGFS
jgi:uncharacterized membrane-anchored protein YitT (DUF2179 family)